MTQRFALLWCGPQPPSILQTRLLDTFQVEGAAWDVLRPGDPGFMERARGFDGYVVSGSPKSVVDDAGTPLVRDLLALLRWVRAESAAAVVGVCFGSQALAASLGGVVGRNPGGGFKLGSETLAWTPAANAALPEAEHTPVLVESHGECVLALPSGVETLATSPTARYEVFLADGRLLGIQGHPEADSAALRATFMAAHRDMFDAAQWQAVEREAARPLNPGPVATLARRLLAAGRL